MDITKKTLFPENLDSYNTFVQDTNPNSAYFNITELPDTFTGGKNAFLIAGSNELVSDTLIKIEIKDAVGNVIYHEPGEGYLLANINGQPFATEYYEGVSKVVAVYVYPDTTAYGPCTITILGELSSYYDSNNILTSIPTEWQGTYNVKWQKTINVNPTLANTTKIRFYKRPTAQINEILSPIYTIVSGSKVESGVVSSFADVKLSQLDTFAGDVKRIKVYRTSQGDISDYDMIQDILVESKEELTSYNLSGSVVGNAGLFTSEVLQKLWTPSLMTATLDSSRIDNGVKLTVLPNPSSTASFTYTSSLNISENSVYEFGIDAFYSSSVLDSDMKIYVSGSNNGEVLIGTLNGVIPTKNLEDTVFQFSLPIHEPTASLYLAVAGNALSQEWHVGNISLKLTQDSAFSPSEISFVTSMPTVVGNETYNFKFEFYDVNNNYAPVEVTSSALFTGGNNNIGGTIILISSSLSQSLDALYTVSSSISGTVTFNSSSISGTVGSLSSSVSGSIGVVSGSVFTLSGSVSSSLTSISASVSASFSSSTAYALSQSNYTFNLATSELQKLADGNYSGSFIGETTIYSPAIGGQNGYISGVFKVGQDGITLDGPNRAMYVGTGVYNNSNTPFYFKSGSTNIFSLADKLSWDGATLTVNGTINVTGGNAATQTYANNVGTNAIASASLDATTKANTAFTSAKAVADSIAAGTYNGGTFISNNSIVSPVVAGANGYFSQTFRVGDGGITLDGTNKRIFVGAGSYNNSNTPFYFASGSTNVFSLGDKLTFDNSTLSVSGTITSTAGSIGGWVIESNKLSKTVASTGSIEIRSNDLTFAIKNNSGTEKTVINASDTLSTYTQPTTNYSSSNALSNAGLNYFSQSVPISDYFQPPLIAFTSSVVSVTVSLGDEIAIDYNDIENATAATFGGGIVPGTARQNVDIQGYIPSRGDWEEDIIVEISTDNTFTTGVKWDRIYKASYVPEFPTSGVSSFYLVSLDFVKGFIYSFPSSGTYYIRFLHQFSNTGFVQTEGNGIFILKSFTRSPDSFPGGPAGTDNFARSIKFYVGNVTKNIEVTSGGLRIKGGSKSIFEANTSPSASSFLTLNGNSEIEGNLNVIGELDVNGPIVVRGINATTLTTSGVNRFGNNVTIFGKTRLQHSFRIERDFDPFFSFTTVVGNRDNQPGQYQGIYMKNALTSPSKEFIPDIYLIPSSSASTIGGRINTYHSKIDDSGVTGLVINTAYNPVGTTGSQAAINDDSFITVFRNNNSNKVEIYGDGDVIIDGYLTEGASDERLKDVISPITNSLDKINQISGFYYKYNQTANNVGLKDTDIKVGVSAQELERVLPEVVTMAPFDRKVDENGVTSISGNNYKTVYYDKIVPLLIEGIKELSQKVNKLEEIISGST